MRIHDEIVNVSEIRRGAAWHVTTENERGFDIRSAGDGYHVTEGERHLRREDRFSDAFGAVQGILDWEFSEAVREKAKRGKAL